MILSQINFSQVLKNHGIIFDQIGGSLNGVQGFVHPSDFEQCPSQAVDIIAVVRLKCNRALREFDGFLPVDAAIGVTVAQVIERVGVIGIVRQHRLHCSNHVGKPVQLVVSRAQIKTQVRIRRRNVQTLFKRRGSLDKLLRLKIRQAQ